MRISILISIFVTSILIAQPIKHIVSPDFGGPRQHFVGDLDGDGDQDVASAGYLDGLAWWENSQGVFGPEQGVELGQAGTVTAGTIDSDSIVDLACGRSVELAWYEGPMFTVKHVIDSGAGYAPPNHIQLVDMDFDGDLDLLSSHWDSHEIMWRENGNNWTIHTIVSSWTNPVQVVAIDLNDDGNLDVIATSRTLDRVSWFEGPLWNEHIIDDSLDGAHEFDWS
jgi:hypothetical protein